MTDLVAETIREAGARMRKGCVRLALIAAENMVAVMRLLGQWNLADEISSFLNSVFG